MKKGFTLVELLAVIVLLGIIATLVYSVGSNSKETAKKKSIETSAIEILKAAERYDSENGYKNFPEEGLDIFDLEIQNLNFESGKVIINANDKYELVNLYDGTFCINGTISNIDIKKGVCAVD